MRPKKNNYNNKTAIIIKNIMKKAGNMSKNGFNFFFNFFFVVLLGQNLGQKINIIIVFW